MKKLLAVAIVVLSLASGAAMEKLGTVQVADANALVAGITKVGEFTGNASLGLMASSSLAEMPCNALFGPGRAGVPFAAALFKNGDDVVYAFLYPVAKTQNDFLLAHPCSVGADGVLTLKDEDADDDDATYIKFSADGQWVALSDCKATLDSMLKDVKTAARPMKGALLRLDIAKKGMKAINKFFAEEAVKHPEADDRRSREIFADVESVSISLVVDAKGVAMRGKAVAVANSKLAKCGLSPIADNALSFAGKDALMASAVAKDCGQVFMDVNEIRALLTKYGIKTDFLTIEEKAKDVTCLTLDVPAAIAYAKSATNVIENIDGEKFMSDAKKLLMGYDSFKIENPAMASSFAIKGYATKTTPAARIKAILPEIAKKKPYTVHVMSFYAMLKAVIPDILNGLEPDERASLSPILAVLPEPGDGGLAMAVWRDKNAHRFIMRVSPDEIKGFAAAISGCIGYQTIMQLQQSSCK